MGAGLPEEDLERGQLAAIGLFGFESGAALATVVGALIEAPVMLTVVWIVNHSRDWYDARAGSEIASGA